MSPNMTLVESSKPLITRADSCAQECIGLMKNNPQSHAVWAALMFGELTVGNNPVIVFGGSYGGSTNLALNTMGAINEIHTTAGCDMGYSH